MARKPKAKGKSTSTKVSKRGKSPRTPATVVHHTGAGGRVFGQARPSTSGTLEISNVHTATGNQTVQPAPPPRTDAPVSLDSILSAERMTEINSSGKMVFHAFGDSGGVKQGVPQQIVAMKIEHDTTTSAPTDAPSFLYHLGDVVYYNGDDKDYFAQFYEPYTNYPNPIFAIMGNHDGDPDPADPKSGIGSFLTNFCALSPVITSDAQEAPRHAMTQPGEYWTLATPLATIVGLYTNVPQGGVVLKDQADWFVRQLQSAPKNRALIVALHHPPYSADDHHGGSAAMATLLDTAFGAANRWPDLVLTGHVHNYQRFTRQTPAGQVPYVVAGAGGYFHLHSMAPIIWSAQLPLKTPINGITLDNFCASHHGFMKITVTKDSIAAQYLAVPRPHEGWHDDVKVCDEFQIDLKAHTVKSISPPITDPKNPLYTPYKPSASKPAGGKRAKTGKAGKAAKTGKTLKK